MNDPNIKNVCGPEDATLTVYEQVRNAAGAIVAQADVTSITLKVFDLANNVETLAATPAVASVIVNTPSTAEGWRGLLQGWNFKHLVAATAFPKGGRIYRIEYKLVLVNGETVWVLWNYITHELQSS